MDELLEALKEGDEEKINILAQELFMTRSHTFNLCQINEFERYAPCQVELWMNDCTGVINYHGKNYMFG